MSAGHAFAVIKVGSPPPGFDGNPQQAVLLYNPHARDSSDLESTGDIKHVTDGEYSTIEGVFWMTFDAFYKSVSGVSIHGVGTDTGDRKRSVDQFAGEGSWAKWQGGNRLAQLDNFDSIQAHDKDNLFPSVTTSVCQPGDSKFIKECLSGVAGSWTKQELTIQYTSTDELDFTFDQSNGLVDEVKVGGHASDLFDFKYGTQFGELLRSGAVSQKASREKLIEKQAESDAQLKAQVDNQRTQWDAALKAQVDAQQAQQFERTNADYKTQMLSREAKVREASARLEAMKVKGVWKLGLTNTETGGGATVKVIKVGGQAFGPSVNVQQKVSSSPGTCALVFELQPLQFLDFAQLKDKRLDPVFKSLSA